MSVNRRQETRGRAALLRSLLTSKHITCSRTKKGVDALLPIPPVSMEQPQPEEQFLCCARNGDLDGIRKLLASQVSGKTTLDINCKGKSKSNRGWRPLHLASYFGHIDVVDQLLKAGADVNLPNNIGDTPLHKAAFTGRKVPERIFTTRSIKQSNHQSIVQELVMLLLHYNASATVINGTAQTPKDLTRNAEIRRMLAAAERTEERKQERQLLEAAREGDIAALSQLLSSKKPPNLECADELGNTPLHCAAYRGQKQCAAKLLRAGARASVRNKNGQTVLELASDAAMTQLLEGNARRGMRRYAKKFEGLLWKSSGSLGWRSCWVVLHDGVLSWYSKRSDAAANVRRQGSKSLTHAQCLSRSKDCCIFTLTCYDDSVHYFKVSAKEEPEATRKAWLDALDEHSAFSTHYCSQEKGARRGGDDDDDDDDDDDEEEEEEEGSSLGRIADALQAAGASHGRLRREVAAVLSLIEIDGLARDRLCILEKLRAINELSSETGSNLDVCLGLVSKQEVVRSMKLELEVEKNKILSRALQTLATEHHELEQVAVKGAGGLSDDEFHDAVSGSDSELSLSGFETAASRSFQEEEEDDGAMLAVLRGHRHSDEAQTQPNGVTKYRTSLPSPMFSRNDFSIWSILRNCIGMELSKIAMPVIFNEPLSFLQRLTEYMEHTYLIRRADAATESLDRMKCVAAFAVSAVASQWERTGKPFNPLLGETYELVREDLGFRLVSEQVSHHPPVSAFHAEGLQQDFAFHGSICPKLKFWGKSVQAEPKGVVTLELPNHNEAYTWTNPTCCVHNIIVGQLWIEQYGSVEVINHRTGEKCCLNFKPCGLFGKELHKVEGYILDKSKKKLCALYGKWTECLYVIDPAALETHRKSDRKGVEGKNTSRKDVPSQAPDSVDVVPGSQLLWRIAPRPANSAQMYSFTTFAMQLNELHEDMAGVLPRTDCRLRPDIRAMENGDIDLASEEKKRLEEKQRATRKKSSRMDDEWKMRSPALCPRWFQQGPNPHTGSQDWIFTGRYWDRKYPHRPDIY
ncbi:oxysterol-binding protein-related protein 1 isoform X3 [Phyllopteryx taeniolatus]|uniref:oxysterol-binding protein-related protein 1 isoform X3 n=1 Tax=Phyllopteryx taeniolatus TaxID=161469 RepID=UPI002AD50BBB|nr:oxysterol-binding protein-related protein 1 isoform X3 [Phyllopteryx taeniolatus]